jgi:hypothetical protein
LDDNALASLEAERTTDVPGRLIVGARGESGAPETVPVLVHAKGGLGSKRPIDDKPALKIKAADGGRILGLERLTLNNMVQDPTMLREALGYQVYADAGVAVPETGYVRLTVNGQPYGLYLHAETIDRAFLARRFDDPDGILYEGAYGTDLRPGDERKFELHEGDDPGRAALTNLVAAVATPGDGVFYGERALVDAPSFLAMMAVEPLIADWDNYYKANNYRIYWSPKRQRWFFIPTGLDQTFTEEPTEVFGAAGLLFQKCLASERCTVAYVEAVRSAADRFERLDLDARIDRLIATIDDAAHADARKPHTAAAMATARAALRQFVATRADAVRADLACVDGGREKSFAACAGVILFDSGRERCTEIASRHPEKNGESVREVKCTGDIKQRWRLVPTPRTPDGTSASGALALQAVSTGHCLEVGGSGRSGLRQRACTSDPAQRFTRVAGPPDRTGIASVADPRRRWTVERSIVE